MGIWDEELAINYGQDRPEECFLCGEPVPKPPPSCIYWIGMDGRGMIFLHYSCAATLAAHLQSDFTRFLIHLDIKRAMKGN